MSLFATSEAYHLGQYLFSAFLLLYFRRFIACFGGFLLFTLILFDDAIRIDTDEPEFSRWQWMPPADILSAIVPFKRSVYEEVFAAFDGQI